MSRLNPFHAWFFLTPYSGGGASDFLGLSDTPNAYAGQALLVVRVNAGETALEFSTAGTGTVTTVSVATANGFAGTVANATTTPAITISTTITGLLQGNGTAISGITNSSTVGEVLRVTGASTYAWGAIDLTNGAAYTGALPQANGGTGSSSAWGAGVLAWVLSPTATNLRAAVSGTTGDAGSALVFATSPTLVTPTITTKLNPTTDDGAPLGDTTHNWSDLFLASGAVINYANSNVVITQTSGILTMGTGTLKITTPTNTATSVVTIDGTQTLTNKSISGAQITSAVANATLAVTATVLAQTKQTLADGANVAWDMASGTYGSVTLGGDRTIDAPSNVVQGGRYLLDVIQDGTGTRLLTWASAYKFPGGVAPTLTATINKVDVFEFYSPDGTNLRLLTATFGF